VVSYCGNLWEQIRNFLARLAVLFEFRERTARFQFRVLQLSKLLAFGERFGKRLAIKALQFRFVIETLKMGRTASHAEVNDSFSANWKVGRIDDSFPTMLNWRSAGTADQFRIE